MIQINAHYDRADMVSKTDVSPPASRRSVRRPVSGMASRGQVAKSAAELSVVEPDIGLQVPRKQPRELIGLMIPLRSAKPRAYCRRRV